MGYSLQVDEETTAKAYGRELPISPKKAREACRVLRGRSLEEAREILEGIIEKRRAVPYRRYKTMVAHRPGLGPGGYPVKVARHLLKLLESAQQNAEYKGLDPDVMVIQHIVAYRGTITKTYRPRAYGRSSPWFKESTNVEVILREAE